MNEPAATDATRLKLKGLKVRQMIAQGKRRRASAAQGNQSKNKSSPVGPAL